MVVRIAGMATIPPQGDVATILGAKNVISQAVHTRIEFPLRQGKQIGQLASIQPTFKHTFLDANSKSLQYAREPIPPAIICNVEADHDKHGYMMRKPLSPCAEGTPRARIASLHHAHNG